MFIKPLSILHIVYGIGKDADFITPLRNIHNF